LSDGEGEAVVQIEARFRLGPKAAPKGGEIAGKEEGKASHLSGLSLSCSALFSAPTTTGLTVRQKLSSATSFPINLSRVFKPSTGTCAKLGEEELH
jgi:hypothetical protein